MSSTAAIPSAQVAQGFSSPGTERMPLMALEAMSPAQREAADALIAGPRKAVFGPFIPLLRSPELMNRIGKVGEYLRFESLLDARIRELVICRVARQVSNQFEWLMHAPLALQAGVQQSTLDAIAAGRQPRGMAADEAVALDFTSELLLQHGSSDATYAEALASFGEQGVVELTTLVGYFVMVCWVMNVARTPTQGKPDFEPLTAFPA
ncbi:4-carboxymuconolactone decarboxylase [Polaromonas sp. OV174]|uniref:carboxymuconolactone decarboxylase family protein n=1 Tax=Polaromonas sp. OV174 TaxID=1855300 RepID=UPI0008DEFB7B|nr:carboxymuconolactone decarboxylase family protein [Polaromonas sp. OV174]SFB86650.1 4-carboxymuconolactone decarboxylase [Polaromonas sp. OV174]